jgi:hypothetical protein
MQWSDIVGFQQKFLDFGTGQISTSVKIWLVGIRRRLPYSGDGRLLEREGRLCRLIEGRLHLPSGKNDLRS